MVMYGGMQMNNELNLNEIVKIEQMPKVFSQLEKIGELIDEKTSDLNELECTDDNKQEVKNRRTEINKTLEALEDRRKEIKNKLLEPYDVFEEKYNKECKEKLQNASNLLKNKVDEIEKKQKQEKQDELREFANQHIEANNLQNIITFEDINLNITLSASIKSLKEESKRFIEDVSKDVNLINLEEYKEEILLQYMKNGFDFASAKLDVIETHKKIEEMQQQQELQEEQTKQEEKIVEKVEEVITPPKEIINDDEVITVTFTITDTKEKIIKLRDFLKENDIKYE